MFNKEKIIEILNEEDLYIDNFLLEAFIKNWKLEPIYEDAQGVEFFDEMTVEKIRNGIKQKQPKSEINIVDKDEIKSVDMSVEFTETPEIYTYEAENCEVEQLQETVEEYIEQDQISDNVIEPEINNIEISEEAPELPVAIVRISFSLSKISVLV